MPVSATKKAHPRRSIASSKARPRRSAERTQALFLAAAEQVFGHHGYEGTTIRAIARKARVNLGTLQHYWGSKRQLFRDLFESRFRPLEREHTRRLRAIEQRAQGGARPASEEILRALIEPTFLLGRELPYAGQARGLKQFHRLYGRALLDPSPVVIAEITRIFATPVELFLQLMQRACPQLSGAELDWRVNCIIGSQVFSMVYSERVGAFFGPEVDVDARIAAEWIIHFLVHGIEARACQGGAPHSAAEVARSDRR